MQDISNTVVGKLNTGPLVRIPCLDECFMRVKLHNSPCDLFTTTFLFSGEMQVQVRTFLNSSPDGD
jgi:hypothetical protein